MTVAEEFAIGASAVAILTGFVSFFVLYSSMISRFAKIELKVETLWGFLMRRSLAQGLGDDVLQMNSPVVPTEKMETALAPMAEDLGKFYKETGCKLSSMDLFMEIEKRFGDRILHEICIPYGIHQGAAVIAAGDIAKKTAA